LLSVNERLVGEGERERESGWKLFHYLKCRSIRARAALGEKPFDTKHIRHGGGGECNNAFRVRLYFIFSLSSFLSFFSVTHFHCRTLIGIDFSDAANLIDDRQLQASWPKAEPSTEESETTAAER